MRLAFGLLLACLGVLAPVRVEIRLLPVAVPHVLVGMWAPVCGSVAGELYGVTVLPDGRLAANDGTKVCCTMVLQRLGSDVVLQLNDKACPDACVGFLLQPC